MAKTINLVVKYNIKKALPRKMRVSKRVEEALNKKVQDILVKASERASANKRKTVMFQDL